jgi:hypothetical protein
MGEVVVPNLTQIELEQAANAAAAIVTGCNMDSTDGFVAAAELVGILEWKTTRGSALEFNFDDICAVLAHATIRSFLEKDGFKFERNRCVTDNSSIAVHRLGCTDWAATPAIASCRRWDQARSTC